MAAIDFYNLADADKKEIFEAAATSKNLPAFAVEKDWWVVLVLDQLFQMDIGAHMVFKGGTSLSKSWNIIDRFSEDIDLAIDRGRLGFEGALSRKGVKNLRKASYTFISEEVYPALVEKMQDAGYKVEINLGEVKSSDQDPLILELYHPYVTDQTDYIKPRLLIEIGCRSLREPFTDRTMRSFVGELYAGRPFADDYISIPSVNVERTFLEKLFLLHEEFQRPKQSIRVERLSRHIYDVHMISITDHAAKALDPALYEAIVEHRKVFSRFGGVDYASHYPPGLNPIPEKSILQQYEIDYMTMQESMIPGDSPSWQELVTSLQSIADSINKKEALKR